MVRDQNPQHWKLLIFYYNPENPRLFVQKRTGMPFTLNFARPMAWAMTVPIIARRWPQSSTTDDLSPRSVPAFLLHRTK